MKIAEIDLDNVKCSDGWHELACELGLEDECDSIFQYGEYANFTIKVDENLNIVGGKIYRHKPKGE